MKQDSIKILKDAIVVLVEAKEYSKSEIVTKMLDSLSRICYIETEVSNKKFDIFSCCGKDGCRPMYEGVYYDNGIVATNGISLVKMDEKYPKTLEGKIIRKDGTEIKDYRFPNYMSVVPRSEGENIKIDLDACRQIEKQWKSDKRLKAGNEYVRYRDRSVRIGDFINFSKFISQYKSEIFYFKENNEILAKSDNNFYLLYLSRKSSEVDSYILSSKNQI